MEAANYEYSCKVVVVGEPGVGKSPMLYKLVTDDFKPFSFNSTEGVDNTRQMIFNVLHHHVMLRFWDVGRFTGAILDELVQGIFLRAGLVVFVFDLTCQNSFDRIASHHLPNFKASMKSDESEKVPLLLIGNKSDLQVKRTVTTEVAESFAAKNDMFYIEYSSAKCSNSILLEKIREILEKKLITQGTI